MRRRSDSGQVGVETALVMPMTVFMILGILQLSMMQQARLLTEYAAYRAVRSGSLNQADCTKMVNAAVEGLLPSLGRTDTAKNLALTWISTPTGSPDTFPVVNRTLSPFRIVDIDYIITAENGTAGAPYLQQDFDDPDHPLTLTAQVTYNFQMRIPFADEMIHEMWTGGNYFNDLKDDLIPASKRKGDATRQTSHMSDLKYKTGDGKYFVPLRASYSMRMMSNPIPAMKTKATCP